MATYYPLEFKAFLRFLRTPLVSLHPSRTFTSTISASYHIIFGGTENDFIWGDDSAYYTGASGEDVLFGGAGNDIQHKHTAQPLHAYWATGQCTQINLDAQQIQRMASNDNFWKRSA